MYDSIRDVAQQEIFNSYRGILRISPNFFEEAEIDDTTSLYNPNDNFYSTNEATNSPDSSKTKINLSDSSGNLFDVYFYPKTFNCSVVSTISANKNVDLVNIVHYYNILRVNKTLNIKSTLSCNKLITNNADNILRYPIDCPYDSAYCNKNDALGIGADISPDNIENKFSVSNLISKLSSYTQVTVDDQLVWRKSDTGSKIPEVYRHDYILGHSNGGTRKINSSKRETQLSFISLDKMIWEKLTAALNGIGNNRHYRGRYNNLCKINESTGAISSTSESIASKIFGSSTIPTNNAPILGIPVQSGLIMYTAMPVNRYYFHLNNFNLTNDRADTYVYNLISEYALCDGKILKSSSNTTSYSKIAQTSKNWNNFKTSGTDITAYSQIHKSMKGITPSNNNLYTPALLETDQLSPRYLRGLNWNTTSYAANNIAHAKTINGNITSDLGNNKKNITKVGPYLANHDYKIRKTADHQHHCLVNQNAVPEVDSTGKCNDTLYTDTNWCSGKNVGHNFITPTFTSPSYKNSNTSKPNSYKGTYILQTKTGAIDKEWQDIPIAAGGGSRSRTCSVGYSWKGASCIKLPFKGRICHNHKDHNNRGSYAPCFFYFKGFNKNINVSNGWWKTISSVNKHFITYGIATGTNPTVTTKYSLANNTNKLDDTLSFPATFNFLPLIKI